MRRKMKKLLALHPSARSAFLKRTIRFSTAAAAQWEDGVSMVQGASRRIGIEFLLQRRDKGHVVATCRDPSKSPGLLSMNEFAERISILPLDVTDESTIEASSKAMKDQFGSLYLSVTKNVSVEYARKKDPIICILLHPGTVLSKTFQSNVPQGKLFTKEFSLQRLLSIIDDAKSGDNGKFFAWDGEVIVW